MRWLVATLMLAGALSGCTTTETPNLAQEPDATIVTDPTDYSYVETDGEGWHVHDYWGGQDTLEVINAEYGWHASCGGSCTNGMSTGASRMPEGAVVPQGTSQVNVTISWTDRSDSVSYGNVELWIRTAMDSESQRVGNIANGETFVFETTNAQNDPPHQQLSLWGVGFTVHMDENGSQDGLDFNADYSIKMVAVRGLEIPAYPPHPDPWQGRNELPLVSEQSALTMYQENTNSGSACYGGCLETHAPDDGVIVPWDAEQVVITLNHDAGPPAFLGIRYHGADTWGNSDVITGERGDLPTQTVFHIDVGGAGDSPYAKQSLWEFRVVPMGQPGDTQRYVGGYSLSAVVVREA